MMYRDYFKSKMILFGYLLFCTLFMTTSIIYAASGPKKIQPKRIPKANSVKLIKRQKISISSDLIIDSITTNPVDPNYRDEFEILVRVGNNGPGISDPCKLSIKVGGEWPTPVYSIPRIAPGATFTKGRTMLLPIALNYLCVVTIDSNNTVAETNENNNQKNHGIIVKRVPLSDLVIHDISMRQSSPTTEDTIIFTIKIKNQGFARSSGCKVEVKIGDESNPQKSAVVSLAPSAIYTVQRYVNMPEASTYSLVAKVDVDRQEKERNERNNQQDFEFTVVNP